MGQSGVEVCVRHFFDAEIVEHLVVRAGLQTLKLVDDNLAVENRDEIDELFVLLNIHVKLLDGG